MNWNDNCSKDSVGLAYLHICVHDICGHSICVHVFMCSHDGAQ